MLLTSAPHRALALKGMSREALRVIFRTAVAILIFSATGSRETLSRPPTRHGIPAFLSLFRRRQRYGPGDV